MRTTRKARMPKADWVYRPNGRNTGGSGNSDVLGSYEPQVLGMLTGVDQATVGILYDSADHMRSGVTENSQTANTNISSTARAEGKRARILGYEGIMYVEPSTWAVGNLIAMGVRIGKFEQDSLTGLVLVEAEYSMWEYNAPAMAGPNVYANGTPWVEERRMHYGFSDNSVFTIMRFRRRCNVVLRPNECFAMWCELEATSVNTRIQRWMRTLVVDEG